MAAMATQVAPVGPYAVLLEPFAGGSHLRFSNALGLVAASLSPPLQLLRLQLPAKKWKACILPPLSMSLHVADVINSGVSAVLLSTSRLPSPSLLGSVASSWPRE